MSRRSVDSPGGNWVLLISRRSRSRGFLHVLPLAGVVTALAGILTRNESLVAPAEGGGTQPGRADPEAGEEGGGAAPLSEEVGHTGPVLRLGEPGSHSQEQRGRLGAAVLLCPRPGAAPAEIWSLVAGRGETGGLVRKRGFTRTWGPTWPWFCGVRSQMGVKE